MLNLLIEVLAEPTPNNRNAFLHACYESMYKDIYIRCLRFMKNHDDAETAVHGVFLKICESDLSKLPVHSENALQNYLRRVCRNYCIDAYRRKQREVSSPDIYLQDDNLRPPYELDVNNAIDIANAIEQLTAQEQRIIQMWWSGYSYPDIGREVHKSERAIANHIYRIKQKLRNLLRE